MSDLVDVRPEPAQEPSKTDVFQAYVSILPRWLRRFKIVGCDAKDVMQEVWLAVCDGTVKLPADTREARLELFKVTRRIAQRVRRNAKNEAGRHVPEPDEHANAGDEQARAEQALAVFEAFERLEPQHRQLARDYFVLGYTIKEMAERAGVPEDRMEKWVWRVSAELERFRQKDQRQEDARDKKRSTGMLIAPCVLELDAETRATFCAIWDAEGQMPELGGGPPPPKSFFRKLPWLSLPSVAGASGVVRAVLALMLLTLFTIPVIAAMHSLGDVPRVAMAQCGLYVPTGPRFDEVKAIDEVLPVYPTVEPPIPSPAATTAANRSRVKPMPLSEDVDDTSNGPLFERLNGD